MIITRHHIKQFILFLFIMLLNPCLIAGNLQALNNAPVILEKSSQMINRIPNACFTYDSLECTKIWVFFTDKGIKNNSDFLEAANRIELNENARKRRIVSGVKNIVFADIQDH